MQLYQLNYLITPEIKKEEITSLQDRLTSFIKDEDGELVKIGITSRKKLAYAIKGKKEAFLTELTFKLENKSLVKLEKKISEEQRIIRYLLIKERVSKRKSQARTKRKIKPKAKVELKEIEKKLEEILGG